MYSVCHSLFAFPFVGASALLGTGLSTTADRMTVYFKSSRSTPIIVVQQAQKEKLNTSRSWAETSLIKSRVGVCDSCGLCEMVVMICSGMWHKHKLMRISLRLMIQCLWHKVHNVNSRDSCGSCNELISRALDCWEHLRQCGTSASEGLVITTLLLCKEKLWAAVCSTFQSGENGRKVKNARRHLLTMKKRKKRLSFQKQQKKI